MCQVTLTTGKGAPPSITYFGLHEGIFPFPPNAAVNQLWSFWLSTQRETEGGVSSRSTGFIWAPRAMMALNPVQGGSWTFSPLTGSQLGLTALSHTSHRPLYQYKDRIGQEMGNWEITEAFKSICLSPSKFWFMFSQKIYKIFIPLLLQLWQN